MVHRLAPQAVSDLDDAWFYVATQSGSVYRVEGADVLILRVLWGGRDIPSVLGH